MDELPDDNLLPIVAGYLPPADALRLAATCKKVHATLSLTATPPRELLAEFRRDRDDGPRRGFEIPVPTAVKCHSVLLSATWKGEGRARREGRVFVVAERKDAPPIDGRSSGKSFGGGRLVYASAPAPGTATRLDISFRPKGNESYYLWYTVGGASGSRRSLSLSSVAVRALVYDDPSRSYGNAHNFLSRVGTLRAWDREVAPMIHLDVCAFLESHEDELSPRLADFASDATNISRERTKRDEAFQASIRTIWEAWKEEYYAYARTVATWSPFQYQEGRRTLEAMQVDDFVEDTMDVDFQEYVIVVEDC
ncbi:hypothetical protein ACHAWF_005716 [Thalassiosira exigua]